MQCVRTSIDAGRSETGMVAEGLCNLQNLVSQLPSRPQYNGPRSLGLALLAPLLLLPQLMHLRWQGILMLIQADVTFQARTHCLAYSCFPQTSRMVSLCAVSGTLASFSITDCESSMVDKDILFSITYGRSSRSKAATSTGAPEGLVANCARHCYNGDVADVLGSLPRSNSFCKQVPCFRGPYQHAVQCLQGKLMGHFG